MHWAPQLKLATINGEIAIPAMHATIGCKPNSPEAPSI